MPNRPDERALIAHLRAHAPELYLSKTTELRDFYGRKLLGIRDPRARRMIGREYKNARSAMLKVLNSHGSASYNGSET